MTRLYIETSSKDAAFHFAVEEHAMNAFALGKGDSIMMIWQTGKCAMIGANQIAAAEIDMNRAQSESVQIVRRSSGGGTIYTDPGTLLITVITPFDANSDARRIARDSLAAPIVDALVKMGAPAKIEGRNDILIDGKKVSGFAQYVRNGRICSHGSLLYDADLEALARILRVDDEKIRSKALRSVRSRVANVRGYVSPQYGDLSAAGFWKAIKCIMFEASPCPVTEYELTEEDFASVERIRLERYGNPAWIIERTPAYSLHNSRRFPGGKLDLYVDVSKGHISACAIRGDFLGLSRIEGLESQLAGVAMNRSSVEASLANTPIPEYLGGVTSEELLSVMFDA